MKWSKLLGNLVGNATSAILDMDPGAVYADRLGYRIERRQIHETVAVMRALGLKPVPLPGAHAGLLLRGLALPEAIGRPETYEQAFFARDLAGNDTVTQAGTAMGTPHYMSPEQAMSARDVTFSTDVWALGIMIY